MKKVSRKQKYHFYRSSQREMKKLISKNDKIRKIKRERYGYHVLVSPEVFSLVRTKPRARLLSFTRSVHKAISKGKKRIWFDFTPLDEVIADGMIYFYAEIARLKAVVNGVQFRSTPPGNKTVGQVFNKIEFSKLVNCKIKSSPESNRKDVSTWLCAHGQGVVGEKCGSILDYYEGRIAPALSRELFKGMTEAMTNSHQHAYIQERGDSLKHARFFKPWWLFSQEVDGKLRVVFCDLGLGIPTTIPINHPGLMRRLFKVFGRDLTDSKTIEEAVENSRTRTHKAYRGKGLRQIVETIDDSSNGRIHILSNKGCYNHNSDGETELKEFPTDIFGTVICWQVDLPEYDDDDYVESDRRSAVEVISS